MQQTSNSGKNVADAVTATKISKTELTLTTLQGHNGQSEVNMTVSQRKGKEANSEYSKYTE